MPLQLPPPEVAAFVAGIGMAGAVIVALLSYAAVSARHLRTIKGEVTPNEGDSMADKLEAHIAVNAREHRELKDGITGVHRRVDEMGRDLLAAVTALAQGGGD